MRIRGITLFPLIVLLLGFVSWQPQKGLTFDNPPQIRMSVKKINEATFLSAAPTKSESKKLGPYASGSYGGGNAYFTNGIYDSANSSYYYRVYGAPANVCGTLNIVRNGVQQTTPNWICTDANGEATKGPWTATIDETGENIYIQWPDGTRTSGGDYKVNDVSGPIIRTTQDGGSVPIPNAFDGTASDAQWGSGFDFFLFGWSSLVATFRNDTTGQYYNGQCYCSSSPVYFIGSASPYISHNVTWSVTPPPQSAHNSSDTYVWCASINDFFYNGSVCLYFHGPR